jgi:dihydroorotase
MDSLEIVKPDDWHLHLRDGAALRAVLPDTVQRFARAIIMPNLKPPVVTTALALEYRDRIQAALPAGAKFLPLMTLYLTDNTAPEEIARAQASGSVFAVKYYPAGATTNSDSGVTDIARCDRVLDALAAVGMPLLVHGEVTDASVDVFDRESVFIERTLVPLVRRFPQAQGGDGAHHDARGGAVRDLVGPNVAATLTAHHLLLNRNALFQGAFAASLLPAGVEARSASSGSDRGGHSGNPKFFLGTDSAPHAGIPKRTIAVALASIPRTRRSSCMRRRSKQRALCIGWKVSRATTARTFMGSRATANDCVCAGVRRECRSSLRSARIGWCRCAPARASNGA